MRTSAECNTLSNVPFLRRWNRPTSFRDESKCQRLDHPRDFTNGCRCRDVAKERRDIKFSAVAHTFLATDFSNLKFDRQSANAIRVKSNKLDNSFLIAEWIVAPSFGELCELAFH